ncbi:MAG: hypothetical protein IT537_24600 [Hyphomicrobiales bacterium]|nr:hypothetical protein [Hyphomicrobiales bacterium]
MTELITGAADGAPDSPSIVMTPPADAPQRMGAREAAQLLSSLRRPKEAQQEQAPERAGDVQPEQESEGAVTAQDDAGPERVPGEAGEADPAQGAEPELPSIEPPRAWTKEDKELFATLPRETQQRVVERERAREADFLRRQNDAADKLKGLTAKEQAVEQARQHYEAALPQLLQTLQAQQAGEFADIRTVADVERLAREDWPRYLQWDLAQKKLAAVQQEMLAGQQRQAQEQQQRFAEFAKRQDDLFAEKVPDMADPKKASELQTSARRLLADLGFDDGELSRAWNAQGEFSLRDHRVQMLVLDAMRWRDAQAKARTVTAKPVPPVQRPGTAQPRGAEQAARIQNLEQQLGKARGNNALKLAAQLTAARRAAAN